MQTNTNTPTGACTHRHAHRHTHIHAAAHTDRAQTGHKHTHVAAHTLAGTHSCACTCTHPGRVQRDLDEHQVGAQEVCAALDGRPQGAAAQELCDERRALQLALRARTHRHPERRQGVRRRVHTSERAVHLSLFLLTYVCVCA